MITKFSAVGTPDMVRQRFQTYRDAGINGLTFRFDISDPKSQIPLLESLLDDETPCSTQRVNNNKTYQTQLRDVALVAILLLKEQDPKKFGFTRIALQSTNVFSTNTVGFENDEQRKQTIEKWQKFKASEKKDE